MKTVPKSVLYHELGHTFDLTLLRHRDRRPFQRMLQLGRRGWFATSPPAAGLFAEAYALCSRFGVKRPPANRLGWTRSASGYTPTRRQHRAVCELILRAGAKERRPCSRNPPAPKQPPPSSGPAPGLPGLPGPGLPPLPGP